MVKMKLIIILTYFVLCITISIEQNFIFSNDDEIINLPGLQAEINFRQFSGYLDGGNGYRLFYWFVESQNYPSEDPVVLWLNGGPGCSSIAGLLTENGPFRVAADGTTLYLDPYSWNAFANVLYLESPVNVGFSYNTTKFTESHVYNDEATVDIKYNALINFFEKYPYYKKHEFYITGESYAGVYIPLLTQKILKNRWKNGLHLKGNCLYQTLSLIVYLLIDMQSLFCSNIYF